MPPAESAAAGSIHSGTEEEGNIGEVEVGSLEDDVQTGDERAANAVLWSAAAPTTADATSISAGGAVAMVDLSPVLSSFPTESSARVCSDRACGNVGSAVGDGCTVGRFE